MLNNNLKKILIVDDEEEVLVRLGNILRRANYNTILTTKGTEAIELATNKHPDLIILDIILPDIAGGRIAEILKEDTRTVNIPIIFISGILTKQEEEACKSKNGNCYIISKPSTTAEILETINKALLR